jgi:flagellar biogenesis protein FliO
MKSIVEIGSEISVTSNRVWDAIVRSFKQMKRITAQKKKRKLRVIEVVPFGEKRFVAVVQFGREKFLIGGAATSVSLLTKLGASPAFRLESFPSDEQRRQDLAV